MLARTEMNEKEAHLTKKQSKGDFVATVNVKHYTKMKKIACQLFLITMDGRVSVLSRDLTDRNEMEKEFL